VYLGFVPLAKTFMFVEFVLGVVGTGAQIAPNKAGQTVTVLVADGTLDSLLAGAGTVKRNTAGFNAGAGYSVAAGTELWALIRTAMGTNEPSLSAVSADMNEGHVLSLAGQGALTGLGSFAGGVNGGVLAAAGPLLRATMD
jgi:hypothetical protein